MKKTSALRLTQACNDCGYLCGTDLFYQCLWTRKRCDPGKDLRGSDYLTDLYAGMRFRDFLLDVCSATS